MLNIKCLAETSKFLAIAVHSAIHHVIITLDSYSMIFKVLVA